MVYQLYGKRKSVMLAKLQREPGIEHIGMAP
jgi:hypothetical protein